jgi:hypothetical protein
MSAYQVERNAKELALKVYYDLLDVRHALSWNSIPPTSHITEQERNAIMAARYDSPVAMIPPEVRDALIRVLEYVGPSEKAEWEHTGRSNNHIWPAIRTVWDWLGTA